MQATRWQDLALSLACGALTALLGAQVSLAQTKYRAFDLNHTEPYGTSIAAVSGGHVSGFAIDAYNIGDQTRYCRRAVYWANVTVAPVKLKAFDSSCSDVRGMSGARLVGAASRFRNGSNYSQAMVWDDAADGSHTISMNGFENSWANAVHRDKAVGEASGMATGGYLHAVLWDIRKNTIVDLNGRGHLESAALATNGNEQAGWASDEYGEGAHAMLWSGSDQRAIDLNPDFFGSSYAYAIDAGSEVGVGIIRNVSHALLWHGYAAGAVDLNPAAFVESYATGVSGNRQVGYAIRSDLSAHALVWSGRASAYIDLQQFLPPPLTQSYATSIDAEGDIGGYATAADGTPHAIIWRPVGTKLLHGGRVASNGR